MKKVVLSLVGVFLMFLVGFAQADTFQAGSSFTYPIYVTVNGSNYTEGGGSLDISYLNGEALDYVYCLDLFTTINVPYTYNNTVVNHSGIIYGNPVNNADEVAWLLDHYGTNGQGDTALALQAALWKVVGEGIYSFDINRSLSTANQINLYDTYLTALTGNSGDVGKFYWITPGKYDSNGRLIQYQGLVAPSPVPGPPAILCLASGLLGLWTVRRRSEKLFPNQE